MVLFLIYILKIESQMQKLFWNGILHKNSLPVFLKQNYGHTVNIVSVAASFGLPGIASYCAKFTMGFSEELKHELHNTEIGTTVVSPIMVRTSFFDILLLKTCQNILQLHLVQNCSKKSDQGS